MFSQSSGLYEDVLCEELDFGVIAIEDGRQRADAVVSVEDDQVDGRVHNNWHEISHVRVFQDGT